MSQSIAPSLSMDRRRTIEEAVLRTIVYADLFDYPMTLAEIARYLPGCRASVAEVRACLDDPCFIGHEVVAVDRYFCRRGHEYLIEICQERARHSRRLWRRGRLVAKLLAIGPYVRMVAITGALAVDNCRANDDIDLLVVTVPGRVWISRRLVLLISRVLPGMKLCPNFVLSERSLVLSQRNFYVAHELAQMVPLYGEQPYRRMRHLNEWQNDFLPNAAGLPREESLVSAGQVGGTLKRLLERLIDWCGADRLERWELNRMVELARAGGHLSNPTVTLDEHQCKAHFIDYPALLLTRYREALAALDLDPERECRTHSVVSRSPAAVPIGAGRGSR